MEPPGLRTGWTLEVLLNQLGSGPSWISYGVEVASRNHRNSRKYSSKTIDEAMGVGLRINEIRSRFQEVMAKRPEPQRSGKFSTQPPAGPENEFFEMELASNRSTFYAGTSRVRDGMVWCKPPCISRCPYSRARMKWGDLFTRENGNQRDAS